MRKYLCEGANAQTALYGAMAWAMRSTERRKLNVLELKSLVGVLRWNEL